MTESNWVPTKLGAFAKRHIGPSDADTAKMLTSLGLSNLEALINETVPAAIKDNAPLGFGQGLDETEALARLRDIASQNQPLISLIGQGYYGTILPPVIQRN